MKEVKIKSISIENFKGIKTLAANFDGDKIKVSGQNASGKTTLVDAVTWCLFNKDSSGSEKFQIRPIDHDGNQIDNVEIMVSSVMEIDGETVELKKSQKQKWVKKRGSQNPTLQGNVNEYEIDGYPRSEKDYKAYIAGIIDEEKFKILTNPTYFPSMKWQDQRAILMQFVNDVSDTELVKQDSRFAEIAAEVAKAPSLDEMKKKYQKSKSGFDKQLDEFPVRIDELEKQKVDIDVAELELEKNRISEEIHAKQKAVADEMKKVESAQKIRDEIMELKFKQSDLKSSANSDLIAKRGEVETEIQKLRFKYRDLNDENARTERLISAWQLDIKDTESKKDALTKQWKSVKSETLSEDAKICPTCRRKLAETKIKGIVSDFEKQKTERLKEIEKQGMACKQQIGDTEKQISDLEKNKAKIAVDKAGIDVQIKALEKKLAEMPDSIDVTESDEYKALEKQISDKESELELISNSDELRNQLNLEISALNKQLTEIEKQIARAGQNIEIDDRIAELQSKQRETAQKAADQEKVLYLLDEFVKFKMRSVSAQINSRLGGVTAKLFTQQLNGGVKETCELEYNGVPFSSLNNGHRIVSGLLIIRALQQLYDVKAPIFVDNAESINSFNLPEMNCQQIRLYVSNDKELKVGVE